MCSPAPTCIICLDDLGAATVSSSRTCGFCGKHICPSCLPNLTEIDTDGEADELNGDLRCPNCRRSLIEGDLHARRRTITTTRPNVAASIVDDIVTLEDLLGRVMQLSAQHETGVEYYNVTNTVVAHAIARDPEYTALLERLLKSPRKARALRQSLRRSPTDKATATVLCKEYIRLLAHTVGLQVEHARRILEEVAAQSLQNTADHERYLIAWQSADINPPAAAPAAAATTATGAAAPAPSSAAQRKRSRVSR